MAGTSCSGRVNAGGDMYVSVVVEEAHTPYSLPTLGVCLCTRILYLFSSLTINTRRQTQPNSIFGELLLLGFNCLLCYIPQVPTYSKPKHLLFLAWLGWRRSFYGAGYSHLRVANGSTRMRIEHRFCLCQEFSSFSFYALLFVLF